MIRGLQQGGRRIGFGENGRPDEGEERDSEPKGEGSGSLALGPDWDGGTGGAGEKAGFLDGTTGRCTGGRAPGQTFPASLADSGRRIGKGCLR